MQNNNTTNTNQINQYSSYIQILGKHPQAVSIPQYPYPYLPLISNPFVYCPQLQNKPQIITPQPKKIFVQGNMIAIIDYYDNLWLLSQLFPFHVNVSAMFSRKIKNLYLGQGQCIFNSKKTPIILNWGAKKIIDTSSFQTLKFNQKYFKNANNFFTAYQVNNTHREDKYFYSNIKKIDNSNKLYQICTNFKEEIIKKKQNNHNRKNKTHQKERSQTMQKQEIYSIIAYPTLQTNFMRNKVVGLSIGKVHCMCWDIHGFLYTWGNRTIALGYPQLPIQKISTKPKRVLGLNKYVTMGFAATHYSLALTSDGHLYEWGIKKTRNSINEQLIFQPQILQNGLNESKIIVLKGKLDLFGCLSSKHELFLWGEKSAKFFPLEVQQSLQNKNGYIYEPFRVPYLQNQYVVDFGIGDQFVSLILANSGASVSSQQRIYWDDMIRRVKIKLKFGNNFKTQINETFRESYSPLNIRQSNFLQQKKIPVQLVNVSSEPFQSKIQKAYEQRKLKQQYFKSLRNEEKLFINLLKTKKQNPTNQDRITYKITPANRFLSQRIDLEKKILSSRTKKHIQQNHINKLIPCLQKKNSGFLESSQIAVLSAKKFIRDNFSQTLKEVMVKKTPRLYQPFTIKNKTNQFNNSKLKTETYQTRLEKVQRRKKSLQKNYIEEVSNKIKQNSIQFRNKKHQEIVEAKNCEKHKNLIKNTLVAFLVKNYIIKMVNTPLEQARKIKIQQFAKGLHLSRIQTNLRLIFIKTRVRCGLKKLRKLNFLTYALLCTVFKRYVKKRRQQKNKLMRKIVAQQLYKNVLKQKIRFGIAKTNLNIRKIQKLGQWLKMVKNERIRCLKILWKNYLLTTMRVINEANSIAICKTQQNCTFESVYKQKIAQNPMLSLETFLKKSPIFEIRFEYFQSIFYLYRNENKVKSQKIFKTMKLIRRKHKIKFNGQGQTATVTNGIQNSPDLLPYSLHYNLLIRPKSLELNIPESMKKSQRWIRQEAIIFQKCLNQILQEHERNFLKAKRQYDIDLAYFIREKYDSLAQKRWKSIIEYNQIKITPYKKKREKQLYRIFGLIGMQRILNEDFLPEKYFMLQQAIKKRDAPAPPSSFIVFDINSFKDILKKYHNTISLKSKYFRKNYI